MKDDDANFEVATQAAIERGILDIIEFVNGQSFQNVLAEMWALPPDSRADYVVNVILNADELRVRGVAAPSDLILQRSAFRDDRPTLFCVTKKLPPGLLWAKVTVTYDNADGMPALRYQDVIGAQAQV